MRVRYVTPKQDKQEKRDYLKKLYRDLENIEGIDKITTQMLIDEIEYFLATGVNRHWQIPFWTVENGKVYEDLSTLNKEFKLREVI